MRHFTSPTLLLLAIASFVWGCNRAKPPADQGNSPEKSSPPVEITFPDNTVTDSFATVSVRDASLLNNPLIRPVFEDLAKEGSLVDLAKLLRDETGLLPKDIESVIVDIPESQQKAPAFAVVFKLTKLAPNDALKLSQKPSAKRPDFIALDNGLLMHRPDQRTIAFVHESLVDRYLAGFAKDRNEWPMSSSLAKAAEGHSFVALCNFERIPEAKRTGKLGSLPLLPSVNSAILIVDVHGKDLNLGLRTTFDTDASASRAQEQFKRGIAQSTQQIDRLLDDSQNTKDLGPALAWLKAFRRAVGEMKIEVSEKQVTATTAYHIDFDLDEVTKSIEQNRLSARKAVSANRLRQLALALQGYGDAYGAYPVIGVGANNEAIKGNSKANLSWRVAILPWIENSDLYRAFRLDEPWDSEHNKKLISKMPSLFAPFDEAKAKECLTYYQMVVGPSAMRPGLNLKSITDGEANAIAVVEAAEPVIWTKPDDISIPGKEMPKDLKKEFGGMFPNGFHAALWDGSARWIDLEKISEKTLWNAIRPDDGEPLGDDWRK